MCLAFPGKITSIENNLAKVEISGVTRKVSLMLLPDAKLGDYVLVHAGFAMQIVDQNYMDEMNALRDEMHGMPRTVQL